MKAFCCYLLAGLISLQLTGQEQVVNGISIQWATSVTDAQRTEITKLVESLVKVEGGSFVMGTDAVTATSAEKMHTVRVSTFYISKYEVTQALWEAVTGRRPSLFQGKDLPVDQVSWQDCQVFIKSLNKLCGLAFSLPTEAQWEFAARGGKKSKGYEFCGSNDINSVAWNKDNSGGTTHPVGTKDPNELGLYDMSGNVWEWCCDWFREDYYDETQEAEDPTGPKTGFYRSERGGGWDYDFKYCRYWHRNYDDPVYRRSDNGCRLILPVK